MRCKWIIAILFMLVALVGFANVSQTNAALIIPIKGAIGPATAAFVKQGFTQATTQRDKLIILQMDTPGGLSDAMRDIIQLIMASNIPVVTYVAPSGARAASAGTYILYASHIAAMAPGTNLGAATPVAIGGVAKPSPDEKKKSPDASQNKAMNDAQAYIRSLAQLRGRNAHWGELAVSKAATLTAQEALKNHVIDVIASTTAQLLQKINGRVVKLNDGTVKLDTTHMNITMLQTDWRTAFLTAITNPTIAYILLMIGFYGLFFEFVNPGFVAPGVIGAICLVIGLYALQMLPINYAGLILMVLGLGFIVAEAFVPSFGILGLGGGIAFVVGSILLFKNAPAGFTLSYKVFVPVIIFTGAFAAGIITLAWRSRKRPVVAGVEALVGKHGVVEAKNGACFVRVGGERWQCYSKHDLVVGDTVEVIGIDGLKLAVIKLGEKS